MPLDKLGIYFTHIREIYKQKLKKIHMPTLLTKFEKNFEDISNMCVFFFLLQINMID